MSFARIITIAVLHGIFIGYCVSNLIE